MVTRRCTALLLVTGVLGGCALGVSPVIEELVLDQDQGVWTADAADMDASTPSDDLAPTDTADDLVDATTADADTRPADVGCGTETGAACDPGAVQRCGACGQQTCAADCTWSACVGGGACTPGMHQACGNCGTQTCTETCTWSACTGEGVCAPNTPRSAACGHCGTQQYRCSTACQWVAQGGCAGQGACAPGSTQAGGCDGCSEQVCDAACAWSA